MPRRGRGRTVGCAGVDVLEQNGTCGVPAHGGEQADGGVDGIGVQVPDDHRSGSGAVASPQFLPRRRIGGGEEEEPVEAREAVRALEDLLHHAGANGRLVGRAELPAAGRIDRGEEDRPVHVGHAVREREHRPGVDVLDELRARRRPVAPPELDAGDAVVGGEVDASPHRRQQVEPRRASDGRRTTGPEPDVLHERRAGRRPVAPPELEAGARLGGTEEERAVGVVERPREGANRAWVDVEDPDRARRGAVAPPELGPAHPVAGREEERAVHVRQLGGLRIRRPGIDVLQQDGAAGGAVARPELGAVRGVGGNEEERPAHVGERAWVRPAGAPRRVAGAGRVDVRDDGGSHGGPVAPPELAAQTDLLAKSGRPKG